MASRAGWRPDGRTQRPLHRCSSIRWFSHRHAVVFHNDTAFWVSVLHCYDDCQVCYVPIFLNSFKSWQNWPKKQTTTTRAALGSNTLTRLTVRFFLTGQNLELTAGAREPTYHYDPLNGTWNVQCACMYVQLTSKVANHRSPCCIVHIRQSRVIFVEYFMVLWLFF